jgi:AcrR family transcriptional regulator
MSSAAVYVHYASKQDLLMQITRAGHESVLNELEASLVDVVGSMNRLHQYVETFASWHARFHTVARVAQYELHRLTPDRRAEIVKLRRRTRALLEVELHAGVADGAFDIDDVPGLSLATLSVCIDVARWYVPGGGRTAEGIGRLYADLACRMARRH